jgi:spermidine synthase
LRFDQFTESAVGKQPPHVSWASYTDYFHLALLLRPDLDRTLFIGAGGAVGPRAFHMHNPKMEIDIVDIDPKVLDIASEYFYLEDVPQFRKIAMDGRLFVREAKEPYDAVILDAFTIGGRIPFHLVTEEFFTLCRERLTDDGVFVMNINSSLEGPSSGIFRSTYKTLTKVYPQVYVFFRHSDRHQRNESNNILFVATKTEEPVTQNQWRERAAAFQSGSYIQSGHLQRLVEDLVNDIPDVSDAPVFTDDYAPIETMPF